MNFTPGQRWISETEPELGLGAVVLLEARRVHILFPASGTTRQYATSEPPLKRVRFKVGDEVQGHDGQPFTVVSVEERDGLLVYLGEHTTLMESDLSDTLSFSSPEDRLLAGHVDPHASFVLRRMALECQARLRQNPCRGFMGGRIDLIPHQLFIAKEITSRFAPRVLLADEVGLGKTIEACLILHHLHLCGRAGRILVLVPEALVHQWFVELLRRFNMNFSIFDEERCAAIQSQHHEMNPFLDDQLVLCSVEFLADNPKRGREAVAAGWDLLIVDEAHHLGWSEEAPSKEYQCVESLGRSAEGLLLLTATPEQLGEESHFGRLRLLDPHRYDQLEEFLAEAQRYHEVVQFIDKILASKGKSGGGNWTDEEVETLLELFPHHADQTRDLLERVRKGGEGSRQALIRHLVDQHGTGRVMFRNTRLTMKGFPGRKALLYPLSAEPEVMKAVQTEVCADNQAPAKRVKINLDQDPRVTWLIRLLKKLGGEKVLLLCRTREKVIALQKALSGRINMKLALFHEELQLVQRDRQAAWFHEEDGAQVLLSSEIGGEGRNFQFAHHLVLFDVPADPELLEQRIGRLDRIGQTETIQVHVPYVKGTGQEVLARWYREGVGAFEKSTPAARALAEQFKEPLTKLLHDPRVDSKAFKTLVKETRSARDALVERLEQGRDRLLELNSFDEAVATSVQATIEEVDSDPTLQTFMMGIFDEYGVHVEDVSDDIFLLLPGHMFTDAFPGLPDEGITVTFNRATALSREEITFLSWDHPMVTGVFDLLLGAERGNVGVAAWDDRVQGLYLEAVFVLETIAPPGINVDRYLPPTPISIVVDHSGEHMGQSGGAFLPDNLLDGSDLHLLSNPELTQTLLPMMLSNCRTKAEEACPALMQDALKRVDAGLGAEVERLEGLSRVNDHIRPEEVERAGETLKQVKAYVGKARLRLDAVRVIRRGPVKR